MEEIKSLADQLRDQGRQNRGEAQQNPLQPGEKYPVLEALRAFDNTEHKSMIHVRFDARTLRTMNQLKMATGIDVTRFVAFAVNDLFGRHPEFKLIIKQFLQDIE